MNTKCLLHWLGPAVTCLYICIEVPLVLERKASLGAFLVPMTIFRHINADITSGYDQYAKVTESFKHLARLFKYLNMSTELYRLKSIESDRTAYVNEYQRTNPGHFDAIPIYLDGVALTYPGDKCIFQDISMVIPQGRLVAIAGQHGTGKASFLRLLAHKAFPSHGCIHVPAHLRMANVSMEPLIMRASVYRNLTFGVSDQRDIDNGRIKNILETLRAKETLELVSKNLSNESDAGCDLAWQRRLAGTEVALINLARALIANPEVLLMHRPFLKYHDLLATAVHEALLEHVRERGLCMPQEERPFLRPRTVFYSVEKVRHLAGADRVWMVERCCNTEQFPCRVLETTIDEATEIMNGNEMRQYS